MTIDQVQEFFNMANLTAFIILCKTKEDQEEIIIEPIMKEIASLFTISTAEEYLRNNNFLYFWRHVFNIETIEKYFENYKERLNIFLKDKNWEIYELENFYQTLTIVNYKLIFTHLKQNGFKNLRDLSQSLGFNELFVMMNHIFLFFEFLTPEIEDSNSSIQKKRKIEFQY